MRDTERFNKMVIAAAMGLVLTGLPLLAQGPDSFGRVNPVAGQAMEIRGIVVQRDPDTLTVRSGSNLDVTVLLTDLTEVREKKKNPFRRARNYEVTQLLRGLFVEVEGRGDEEGRLVARKIRFTQTEYFIAQAVESRVKPVESELRDTNDRLADNEENARHLSGQISELNAISNAARGGAKAAQETADGALAGLRDANARIAANHTEVNTRISALDDFEEAGSAVVLFKAGSSSLSSEACRDLDRLAREAKSEKAYMIEIAGFASADGSEARNRILSQSRADAVVEYLVMNHEIPLRRLITPFGYGETRPLADNETRAGRAQNRRVEARILINRAITGRTKTVAVSHER